MLEIRDPASTSVSTGHDSFRYFNAYGVNFLAPTGLSTEVRPAASMAELVDVINDQNVQALSMKT